MASGHPRSGDPRSGGAIHPPGEAASQEPRRRRGTLLERIWSELRTDRRGVALVLVLMLALLFWARLIVVSDVPRTAIADEERPQAGADASDNDSIVR